MAQLDVAEVRRMVMALGVDGAKAQLLSEGKSESEVIALIEEASLGTNEDKFVFEGKKVKVSINGIEGTLTLAGNKIVDGPVKMSKQDLAMFPGLQSVEIKDGQFFARIAGMPVPQHISALEVEAPKPKKVGKLNPALEQFKSIVGEDVFLAFTDVDKAAENIDKQIDIANKALENSSGAVAAKIQNQLRGLYDSKRLLREIKNNATGKEAIAFDYIMRGTKFYEDPMKPDQASIAKTMSKLLTIGIATMLVGILLASCASDNTNQEMQTKIFETKQPDYTPYFNMLIGLLEKVLDKMDQQNKDIGGLKDALKDLKEILKEIKSANDLTNDKLETIKGYIPDILKAILGNADLLSLIIDAIGINGKILEAMLEELTKSNTTLQEIKGMLDKHFKFDEKYKNQDLEYQKTITKILAAIYAAINKLGAKIGSKLEKLIDLMIRQGKSLDEINAKLDKINQNLEKIEARFDDLFNNFSELGLLINSFKTAVLNAINNIDFSVDVDLSGIEALLNRLANSNDDISAKITKLTILFNNFSGTTAAQLDAILKAIGNNDAKLDKIIALMETMDANNKERTAQIISTLEKLIGVNKNGFDVVVDLLIKGNGKLDTLIKQNDTIISLLKGVFGKLEGFEAWFQKIYDKIPEGGQGGCKLDFDALMAKLDEILKAIKDHKVEVKVEVTGEITCNCGCNGTVHEGILGDLNDLLG